MLMGGALAAPWPTRSSSARLSAGTSSRRRVLAQLQGADVGDDGPAVGDRHLGRVVGHRAEAVGDHVEEVADRGLAQAVDVEGGGAP